MHCFRFAALAALIALATACTPPATTSVATGLGDPVAVVQDIYARHLSAHPSAQDANLAPLAPDLLDMLKRSRAVEGVVLDADPVVDANDPSPPVGLTATADAPPANGHVTVTARFTERGQPVVVQYDLVETNGAWLVDNIRGGSGADMRATLTSTLAAETSPPTRP